MSRSFEFDTLQLDTVPEVRHTNQPGILASFAARWSAPLTGVDERVLLSVEDSDADFYVIQMALREAKIAIQVCRVDDGEQAIWFLQRSGKFAGAPRPHLILLNINMPRRNGFDVLEYIKGNNSIRSIPVVMFTTSSDPRERKRALALGADEYITKRGNFCDLVEELSGVCGRFLKPSHSRSENK